MLKDDPYNIYGYLWEVNKIAHLLIGEEFIEVTSEVLYDYRKLSGQQRAQVEAIFNRILQFNPSFYDAHTCLGSFYFADKKYDQSAQHYLSAVGLIKKNIPAKKEQTVYLASLYYGLFLAYQEKGDLSQQEMYKTMIKEISPDDYYNYFLKDKDDAMSSQNGGIDFTANKTPLDIQNSNKGIKFYVDPAILQQLQNVSGFVPVIINIRPVNNITEFLGLND
jgi:tetratricopeptide (TPR) repeat protein